jgi:hypothetical protein
MTRVLVIADLDVHSAVGSENKLVRLLEAYLADAYALNGYEIRVEYPKES